MVRVKPVAALRPPKSIVTEVAAPPYDVLNSLEAKKMAGEKSLLHITKPEIDFDPIADEHSQAVYDKAVENFRLWRERGYLKRDPSPCYYVYAQTMDGRTQYGLVLCAHTDDYASGVIKKHELTRKDKEDDRMIHVRIQNANIEPVFFSYRDNAELNAIVEKAAAGPKEYSFTDENGFGHDFWVISDPATVARITELFTTRSMLSMWPTATTAPPRPPAWAQRRERRTPRTPAMKSTTSLWRYASPRASSKS